MFIKGQSGNPSGRPKTAPEVREAIQNNGAIAVRRMADLLNDDAAWGPNGWIKPREQILLASIAQERAFGKSQTVAVDHQHGGSVLVASQSQRLRQIADQLPERKRQTVVIGQ